MLGASHELRGAATCALSRAGLACSITHDIVWRNGALRRARGLWGRRELSACWTRWRCARGCAVFGEPRARRGMRNPSRDHPDL